MPYVFITPVADSTHIIVRPDPGLPLSKKALHDYLHVMRAVAASVDRRTRHHIIPADRLIDLVDALATAPDTQFPICPTEALLDVVDRVIDRVQDSVDCEEMRLRELESTSLYPFQRAGVVHLEHNPRTLLLDDMGLGKTVQALVAIPAGDSALVVCPKVMKSTWEAECIKWRPDLTPCITKTLGNFRTPECGELMICNYEQLPDRYEHEHTLGTLIADEAHFLKNSKAVRTKRFRQLARGANRVWLLTGTPLMNKPADLWGVLQAGGLGKEAYGTWLNFCDQWGGFRGRWGYQWSVPKDTAYLGLQRVSLRRTKAEVLPDLPAKTYRTIKVPLCSQAQRGKLDDVMGIAQVTDPGKWEGIDGMSAARTLLATAKLDVADDLVVQYEESNEPVVVFSAHTYPVVSLGVRDGWACIHGALSQGERDKAVEDFQAGKLKGLACTIQAAGVGITLTHASHMIFVDRTWSPAMNSQAEDRICRIGQTRGCVYTDIVTDHPLDVLLMETLQDKRELVERTVEKVSAPPSGAMKLERLRTLRQQLATALLNGETE